MDVKREEKPHTSILYCYIAGTNGYGTSAQSLINLLQKIEGVELELVPLNDPNIRNKQLKMQYDIGIVHCSTLAAINDFNQRSFITMCMSRCAKRLHYILWETDRFPQPYIDFYRNPIVTGFISPSHFCESLVNQINDFKKSNYYVPITVGDDVVKFEKQKQDKFTVLTVAQWSVRKAIDLSVCAFVTAFQGHADVEFIIKLGEKLDNVDVDQIIRANVQRSMVAQSPPIYTIDQHLPGEQLADLYKRASVYLHMSRGEGFAITPLTAMNYGLPVIYTNWSAHTEFCRLDPRSIAVDGRMDLVHSMSPQFGFEPGMLWFEPTIHSGVQALAEMYKRWKLNAISYNPPAVTQQYHSDQVIEKVIAMLSAETGQSFSIKANNELGLVEV